LFRVWTYNFSCSHWRRLIRSAWFAIVMRWLAYGRPSNAVKPVSRSAKSSLPHPLHARRQPRPCHRTLPPPISSPPSSITSRPRVSKPSVTTASTPTNAGVHDLPHPHPAVLPCHHSATAIPAVRADRRPRPILFNLRVF
jgi:hypothetical protein